MTLSLLLVSFDATTQEALADYIAPLGYSLYTASSATDGRRLVAEKSPDVVLVDLQLTNGNPLDLVEALLADDPELAVVLLSGHADASAAIRGLSLGATALVEKPIELKILDTAVNHAVVRGRDRRELDELHASELVALEESSKWISPSLAKLIELAARNTDVPILIVGEPGTGKNIVARQIHARSARAQHPFVVANCARRGSTSLDDELFGHERGSIPGGGRRERGILEIARGGSVVLSAISELPASIQPKLLAAIEDGVFHRVGGSVALRSDARIMAATDAPVRQAVTAGRFRADLFFRLQSLTIEIAPLRARRGELVSLAEALLPYGARLSDAGRRTLEAHDWPGNVREMKDVLWRASLLARGAPIGPTHLAFGSPQPFSAAMKRTPLESSVSSRVASIADAERHAIIDALRATSGNKLRAAQLLGIARSTLAEKLRRFELT